MRTDAIFRIYSMTKPIVSVAAMILVEDGVLELTDPVAKWLPAFKDVKVFSRGGLVAAERAMTVQDLLRHTAGLAYGKLTQNLVVKDALTKAGLFKPGVIDFDAGDISGAEEVERLAKVPLLYQPGTTWEYSLATDVLGRVVEAASGKRLSEFMSERIFKPLKMDDTAFWVPADKKGRVVEPFEKDPVDGAPIRLIDVSKQPANDSGGAGGVSTAGDYLRFAQMLANGGALDGQRVLSRTTIKHMTADHLGSRVSLAATAGGAVGWAERSVPTKGRAPGGHGAQARAFAHPTSGSSRSKSAHKADDRAARFRAINASKSNGVQAPLCSPSMRAARNAASFASCSSSSRNAARTTSLALL